MSKEFKVGLLVVVSGAIMYLGFSFLKGKDFFTNDSRYSVVYDNIDGLTISNPVIVNGYKVGRVEDIEIQHDKSEQLLVSLVINGDVPINSATVAELANDGLLGSKAIKLILNTGKGEAMSSGELISQKEESLSALLQKKALPVISNVDTLVGDFKSYMQGENEENITNTIANINETTENFKKMSASLMYLVAKNQQNIDATTANISSLTKELKTTVDALKPILVKVNGFADTLNNLEINNTLATANRSLSNLEGILAQVKGDTGTLGKLMNTPEVHDNLTKTLKDVDYLVNDIQANPSRYIHVSVLGKTPDDEKDLTSEKKVKVSNSGKVTASLKREAPASLRIKVWKQNKELIELIPSGLGSKSIAFDLPADFNEDVFLMSLVWHSGSQSMTIKR